MPVPGDDAGHCPDCDEPMTAIGAGNSVYAVVCDDCNHLIPVATDIRVLDEDQSDDEEEPTDMEDESTANGGSE